MDDNVRPFADVVLYWTQGEKSKNFGDLLTELIIERALIAPIVHADRYRLIGSALDIYVLTEDLRRLGNPEATIVCWGCGARSSSPLDEEIHRRVSLFGVRGPLTRDALRLAVDTPLGDPGLLIPLIYQPRERSDVAGRTLCVPHFQEPCNEEQVLQRTGADVVISPRVASLAEACNLIDAIVSAEFVLAGSLHAAILACAYGRPFAFLDLGFIDSPFKWHDFAASLGIEAEFVADMESAHRFADTQHERLAKPPLAPLLGCCPWAVRPSVMIAALIDDLRLTNGTIADPRALLAATSDLHQDRTGFASVAERSFQRVRRFMQDGTEATASVQREQIALLADRFATQAGDLRDQLSAEGAAARFRFIDGKGAPVILRFAQREAGTAMLQGRWSEPNDIAPVSTGALARIAIPDGSGWQRAAHLLVEGYLFAPPCEPFARKRRVVVYLNGVAVFDEVLENPTRDESFTATLKCEIPDFLSRRSGSLEVDFFFEVLASPKEIGLRDDDRLVGFAPLRMWIELPNG